MVTQSLILIWPDHPFFHLIKMHPINTNQNSILLIAIKNNHYRKVKAKDHSLQKVKVLRNILQSQQKSKFLNYANLNLKSPQESLNKNVF